MGDNSWEDGTIYDAENGKIVPMQVKHGWKPEIKCAGLCWHFFNGQNRCLETC
jgi:hypothetical protein